MLDLETLGLQKAGEIHPTYLQNARNLFHYLALLCHEMRPLQERLSALGLSSLGRTESRVLTSINKVLEALHCLVLMPTTEPTSPAPINSFEEGRALLKQHTEALSGTASAKRTARIIVTMPAEAADSPSLIQQLLANGMDCMRINCAHDDSRAAICITWFLNSQFSSPRWGDFSKKNADVRVHFAGGTVRKTDAAA
jgi:pyruvate kinase